jgi:predicted ABC-type ATPase
MESPPTVYVIGGPNGAGKTTFAREFLPNFAGCLEFVNADLIAQGLSPFNPEAAAFRAGRLMLGEIRRLGQGKRDFAFETTLSGKSYVPILEGLKASGYAVHLFFLWLPEVELSVQRVALRVREGGHDIPDDVIRRRFDKGLRNLFEVYRPLLDSWVLFDNSTEEPRVIAREAGGSLEVLDRELFARLSPKEDSE